MRQADVQTSTPVLPADRRSQGAATFFRDVRLFDALRQTLLPALLQARAATRTLTICCGAAPNGQEAYSLAMLLRESFPELADWALRLIGVDASPDTIARAASGHYTQAEINAGLPARLLVKYFRKAGREWMVSDDLRCTTEFQLVDWNGGDLPLPALDLVLWRDVLAAQAPEARRAILTMLYARLNPDGYLLLGPSEAALADRLTRVDLAGCACFRLPTMPTVGPANVREAPGTEGPSTLSVHTPHLLDFLPSLCILLDPAERVTHWNPAAEQLLGLSAAEVSGRSLHQCPLGWDQIRVATAIDCASPLRPEELHDLTCVFADHTERILHLTVSRLETGRSLDGWLLVGRDVTEWLALEAQANRDHKLAAVGQLAAGIAHEINTPIQFVGDNVRFVGDALEQVLGLLARYAELRAAVEAGTVRTEAGTELAAAERDLDLEYLAAELPKAIRESLEGIDRVATLVRAMKSFAHPDAGSEMAPADLNEAIQSTLIVARNELKYVADVETDLGEMPNVPCHVNELNQVFLNILVNAAHAIAEVVGKSGARGRIGVRTRVDGLDAVVEISDTGGGIPEHVRSRMFDPFFTTKAVGRGTGQGLAIAHTIVGRHGGTLTFETELGRGTTFAVRVPLVAAASAG